MRIVRLIYREEQSSLLNEERSEMRAVLEIEHEGQTGHLRYDADYEKRDADTTLYCDVPDITGGFIADTDWCWKLDEQVWALAPEATSMTPDIDALIVRLTNHQITP